MTQVHVVVSFSPETLDALRALIATITGPTAPAVEPPRAEPVQQPVVTPGPNRIWLTAARRAILEADWRAGVPIADIRERLAALPGDPLPNNKILGARAWGIGLRRPAGFRELVSPVRAANPSAIQPASPAETPVQPRAAGIERPRMDVSSHPAEGPGRAAGHSAAEAPPPPSSFPEKAPQDPPRWSPERQDLLRDRYQRGNHDQLLAALNRLPGPAITAAWMHNYAIVLLGRNAARPKPQESAGDRAPVMADRASVISFCQSRGWQVSPFDLHEINVHCQRVGHPGFVLSTSPRRANAA